ncbi:MAG: 3-hydroxyacyl-[acyl-carrier-protein] dehydratase FabZ [Nitrospirota bacterium]
MKHVLSHELLPHRQPFLMLDRIVSVSDGKASGVKHITNELLSNSIYFPQVLIIEALAQISGIASGVKGHGMLAGVKDIVFHRNVKQGDILYLESSLIGRFGNMFSFSASASVDKYRVADGTLYLNIYD